MKILGTTGFSLGSSTREGEPTLVSLSILIALKRLARICLGLRVRPNLIFYLKLSRSGCAPRYKAKCLVTIPPTKLKFLRELRFTQLYVARSVR